MHQLTLWRPLDKLELSLSRALGSKCLVVDTVMLFRVELFFSQIARTSKESFWAGYVTVERSHFILLGFV